MQRHIRETPAPHRVQQVWNELRHAKKPLWIAKRTFCNRIKNSHIDFIISFPILLYPITLKRADKQPIKQPVV